jgi:hypothetical protein
MKYNFKNKFVCGRIIYDPIGHKYFMQFLNGVWDSGIYETSFFELNDDTSLVICNVNKTGIYGVFEVKL